MKEWWFNLSTRERTLVSSVGVIVLLLILYYFIWSPLSRAVTTLQSQTLSNQTTLLFMQKASQLIAQSHAAETSPQNIASPDERLVLIQQSLKNTDFSKNVSALAQSNNDSVKVQLKDVYFDDIATWLITLWKQNGIDVYEASISKTKTLGKVNATIILAGKSS
jgi:type II secretory pathway component PulM